MMSSDIHFLNPVTSFPQRQECVMDENLHIGVHSKETYHESDVIMLKLGQLNCLCYIELFVCISLTVADQA